MCVTFSPNIFVVRWLLIKITTVNTVYNAFTLMYKLIQTFGIKLCDLMNVWKYQHLFMIDV